MTSFLHLLHSFINPLNAELNPICHLLALLGTHHILHVSRKRVNYTSTEFYVLLTVHLGSSLVNNQLNAQYFFVYIYSNFLHVSNTPLLIIRRISCSITTSVGDRLVCRFGWNGTDGTCTIDGHLHRVTYTRSRINTIDSPDDEQRGGGNM